MEVSEIHENSERLRKINAYLLDQLKKSQLTIGEISMQYDFVLSSLSLSFSLFLCSQALFRVFSEEGIIDEEYQELIQTFTTIIHVDVVPPLLRLLRPIDFLYHGAGVSKRRVKHISL